MGERRFRGEGFTPLLPVPLNLAFSPSGGEGWDEGKRAGVRGRGTLQK
jgi:hypothetical protein